MSKVRMTQEQFEYVQYFKENGYDFKNVICYTYPDNDKRVNAITEMWATFSGTEWQAEIFIANDVKWRKAVKS